MIINDLDGYYIVFDTKNWNTELDTLYNKFDVYGCKYTKIAVKTPQFTKGIAVFLPQNMDIASIIPLMQAFILL